MNDISALARQFDLRQIHICSAAKPPTVESIKKIEVHFSCSLPRSLIEFARHAKFYGNWLASLGEDYESDTHIININNDWRTKSDIDQRLPSNFLILNVGYDEDFDCLDLETYDAETDEYLITYWYPGIDLRESNLHDRFFSYMVAHVRGWSYT